MNVEMVRERDPGRYPLRDELQGLGEFLKGVDIDPNIVTTLGGALGIIGGYFIANGRFTEARVAVTLSFAADATDGVLAKKDNGKWISKFGKFYDSSVDRVVDWALTSGMKIWAQKQGWTETACLAEIARSGSLTVSTLRLEGDKFGVHMPESALGARVPRCTALLACFAVPKRAVWDAGLGFIAVGSGVTSAQRLHALLANPPTDRDMLGYYGALGADLFGIAARKIIRTRRFDDSQYIADLGWVADYIERKAAMVMGEEIHPNTFRLVIDLAGSLLGRKGSKVIIPGVKNGDIFEREEFLAGFENSLGILGTFALVKASLPYPDS